MAFGSDPNPTTPVSNTRREEREGHHHHSSTTPTSLTAFANPEAEWDDADATDEEEWAAASAAAAAELEDEAKWEDAAPAESEADVPAAGSEDDAGGEADTGEPDSPPRWWPSTSARRDPRKTELFRRLDAACEDRRLQEARHRKSPPPPTGAGDPDEPIWPPKSPHWRRFRELSATKSSPANPLLNPDENSLSLPPSNKSKECETFAITSNRELSATKSSPANPVLNPDENSLSLPPSNKSKEMLYDKVVDQGDDTASSQIVPYENAHEEKPLPVPSKKIKPSIDTYAVQCGNCWKWRLIPTKKKYDEIREKCSQVRFLCKHAHEWKPGVSCDDPADISQDDGFWVIDRPCIAQTPLGWERKISIRREGGSRFADVYYSPPKGPALRSFKNLKSYLQDNPDCTIDLQKSKKWFKVPECLQGYLKRCRSQSKPLEPNEVLPLSSAPPIHEDLAPNCVLALYDEGQYCM
ncbi:uncharacterized protein LOC124649014 [Lolium rigidum]|uniref:uncharacterized protein LOC124649014 n=1 Tax=Lolium rigidum TaxID=89674 RepID=UPI001F5D45F8|nr:uncharacterized protein LOC124649014 [Lolium rigidum]